MSLLQKFKDQQGKSAAAHQKLLQGGYGLAKTFWLFWFIPIAIFTIIESYESTGKAIILDVFMAFWSIVIAISILKTTGQKLWKNLALAAVIFDALVSILAIFTYF